MDNTKNFKLFDEVILLHLNAKGYIDTITSDRYRVRLADGYEWLFKWDTNLIHAGELPPARKTKLNYLG